MSIERKWRQKRRERGREEGSHGEQIEGRKEWREAGGKGKQDWDTVVEIMWTVSHGQFSATISVLLPRSSYGNLRKQPFGLEPLVPSSWCTCIHYISLCKTDLLYSLFTSSSFQFCEPQGIPLYLILFSFAREAWHAVVHVVTNSRTWLSDCTTILSLCYYFFVPVFFMAYL